MANKALAKRQKMTIRAEPSRKVSKGRRPVAPGARQPVEAGSRRGAGAALQEKLLRKLGSGSGQR